MAGDIELRIEGLDEVRKALRALPANLRRRALLTSLAAGARVVRDEARRRTPLLKATTYSGASALKRGVRSIGTLRRAIAARTSKISTRRGDVGVFVNIKPLKGGGAKNPRDPYYWRWQEFGWNPAGDVRTGGRTLQQRSSAARRYRRFVSKQGGAKAKPGARFMTGASAKLPDALRVIEQQLGPQVQKLNQRFVGP